MKKQLLFMIFCWVTTGIAYGASFDYNKYQFNIPTANLKIGDTFTITNIDPKAFSPQDLKDANSQVWATKKNVRYGYAGKNIPGPGTATFKVIAVPATQALIPGQISKKIVEEIPGKVVGRITRPRPTTEEPSTVRLGLPGINTGVPPHKEVPVEEPAPKMPSPATEKPADDRPDVPLSVYQKVTGKAEYVTPYEILKIEKSATPDQIKKAWKDQIRFWHTDRNKDPEAKDASSLINWAYKTLNK
jgi:DnaJ-like protein